MVFILITINFLSNFRPYFEDDTKDKTEKNLRI